MCVPECVYKYVSLCNGSLCVCIRVCTHVCLCVYVHIAVLISNDACKALQSLLRSARAGMAMN